MFYYLLHNSSFNKKGDSKDKLISTLSNVEDFINTYIKCGIQLIGNIHKCFFFYLVDIIGKVLYLPVRIVLWFLKLYFDIDFYPMEKRIWNGISYIY